jgi:hypothetical protein
MANGFAVNYVVTSLFQEIHGDGSIAMMVPALVGTSPFVRNAMGQT